MDYYSSTRARHFPMASIPPTIREDEEYGSVTNNSGSGILQTHHSEYSDGMNYQISDSSNSSASGPSTAGGALVPSSSSGIGSKRNKKSTVNNNPLISETEKCNVCGEAAAKHVHYGATTCFRYEYIPSRAY